MSFYRTNLTRLVALFSSIRIYNLFQMGASMYLSALFLFNASNGYLNTLKETKLHLIVFSFLINIAAAYIINNFYDKERDKLIKPIQTSLQSQIKQKHRLYLYVFLNTIAISIAFFASWRILLYIFLYQFILWFYSHKLNKVLFVNNITSALLTLAPFLALVIFYHSWQLNILLLSVLVFSLLVILDVVKDLITYKVDVVLNYKSIPTVLGIPYAKLFLIIIKLIGFLTLLILFKTISQNIFQVYIVICIVGFLITSVILFYAKTEAIYQVLKLFYRLLLFLGIIFIALGQLINN